MRTLRFLFLRACWKLLYFQVFFVRKNFSGLHEAVRKYPKSPRQYSADEIERVCAAIDLACIWSWKEMLCLQRSAATACLLKDSGVPAELVIGAQQIPYKAHAWVEVNGVVVNDKPYMQEIYTVLDRC